MESPLKVNLSLQQMAMIRIAINFWEYGKIKDEIKNYFLTNGVDDFDDEAEEKQREWTTKVFDRFYAAAIPPSFVKHQMTHLILAIGHRLIHWWNRRAQTPMFQYYVDNMFWTSDGTIDEVKIFETLYNNQMIEDFCYLYEEACCLCLEEHVDNLWKKLSDKQKGKILEKVNAEPVGCHGCHSVGFDVYLIRYWQLSDKRNHVFTESWPGQVLVTRMFKLVGGNLDNHGYSKLMELMIGQITDQREFIKNLQQFWTYQILLETWDKIPVVQREQLVEDFTLFHPLLIHFEDVSFLKYVIHHPDLVLKKEELLKKIRNDFYQLFMSNKYKVVEKIVKEVFLYTEEQWAHFKSTLHYFDICRGFIYRNLFGYMDEYLRWQLVNEDDVDYFISNFKVILCCPVLCRAWQCEELEFSQTISKEMFRYFMYDESDKACLTVQMVGRGDFKLTLMELIENKQWEKLNGFLDSCGFNEGEIAQLKSQFSA